MHSIFLATVVLTFVHFSFAGPIVRSVPETNEAASATGKPFETTSFVPRHLQDRSNGFGDDIISVITLIPSLIFPEGTTGASFLVFNPEPTDHSSAAKQTHTYPSSTTTTSRLTAGIIRPLTDFTTKSTSTQSTKTHSNASPQTQTQSRSSTSRPVGSIVPFTKPDTDQTTSKATTNPGPLSSTEPVFTTATATHPTTTSEKTTTVHATSTTTVTAMVTITNPVTVSTTTTMTKARTERIERTETVTKTMTKTMTQCSSSHTQTGVDVIPVHPTGLTTSPMAPTTTTTAITSSSYSPTGVDVIPVRPTWLTTSSTSAPATASDTTSSSYSPTGVDVIPVHPTWATGV